MKQPHILLKVAAVASSVSLIGALVAYHAGAFEWLRGDKPTTLDGSTSQVVPEPSSTDPQPITTPDIDATIMSSSKSMPFIVPPSTKKPDPQPATPKQPTPAAIIWGSKSAPVFPPEAPIVVPPANTPPSK